MTDAITQSKVYRSKECPTCTHCGIPIVEDDILVEMPSGGCYHSDCFENVWENPYHIDYEKMKIIKDEIDDLKSTVEELESLLDDERAISV